MMWAEVSTAGLDKGDRFDRWAEFGTRSLTPVRLNCADPAGFRGWIRVLDLGKTQVSAMTHSSVEIRRTATLVRRSDPEALQLNVFLEGSSVMTQAGREARCGPGGILVLDTSRPMEGVRRCAARERPTAVLVQIPRAVLPLPAKAVDRIAAIPLDGRRGMGGVLARWLLDLTHRAREFTTAEAPALASITVDLVAATLATPLDAQDLLTPQARHRALRLRINRFVDEHLGDPRLSPRTVAEAHHLSLRRLQQVFAADETTPAAWIRRLRLERCRRDLAAAHLRDRPVHVIARRWGFADAAHFTRLFRTAYGIPPGEYKKAHTADLRESTSSVHVRTTPQASHSGDSGS